jgi:hypothetical protein
VEVVEDQDHPLLEIQVDLVVAVDGKEVVEDLLLQVKEMLVVMLKVILVVSMLLVAVAVLALLEQMVIVLNKDMVVSACDCHLHSEILIQE